MKKLWMVLCILHTASGTTTTTAPITTGTLAGTTTPAAITFEQSTTNTALETTTIQQTTARTTDQTTTSTEPVKSTRLTTNVIEHATTATKTAVTIYQPPETTTRSEVTTPSITATALAVITTASTYSNIDVVTTTERTTDITMTDTFTVPDSSSGNGIVDFQCVSERDHLKRVVTALAVLTAVATIFCVLLGTYIIILKRRKITKAPPDHAPLQEGELRRFDETENQRPESHLYQDLTSQPRDHAADDTQPYVNLEMKPRVDSSHIYMNML